MALCSLVNCPLSWHLLSSLQAGPAVSVEEVEEVERETLARIHSFSTLFLRQVTQNIILKQILTLTQSK